MEIYILENATYQPAEVWDTYESFIWTERFSEVSDFQLITWWSTDAETKLALGTWIQVDYSDKVMVIERHEIEMVPGGARKMTVTGKSLEQIMFRRPILTVSGGVIQSQVTTTGVPDVIIRNLMTLAFKVSTYFAGDVLPNFTVGSFNTRGTIPSAASTSVQAELGYVGDVIQPFAKANKLGYRFEQNPAATQLDVYGDSYAGVTRLGDSTTSPEVIFSTANDTLFESKIVRSIENYRTHALITTNGQGYYSSNGSLGVTPPDGWGRTVAIESSQANWSAGGATLANEWVRIKALYPKYVGLDGRVSPSTSYKYNTDYRLGDTVNVYDDVLGFVQRRVSEHIFVSDAQGDRSYPTLEEL